MVMYFFNKHPFWGGEGIYMDLYGSEPATPLLHRLPPQPWHDGLFGRGAQRHEAPKELGDLVLGLSAVQAPGAER